MLLRDRPHHRIGDQRVAPCAGRAPSRVGALILASALALSTVAISAFTFGGASHASAASLGAAEAPAQPAAAADLEPGPEITLAPVSPVLLSNDESAEFELWIENPGETDLSAGQATLSLDPVRVQSESGLATTFPVDPELELLEVDTPEVPAGEGRLVSLTVPRADWPLTPASDAGVYRVLAQLSATAPSTPLSETGAATDPVVLPETYSNTATIVWRGAGGLTRVQLTTIVPMALPETITSLPRRGQLDDLMGDGSELDALLTTAEARGATLAVDPRVVAGVRVYGTSASAASRDFVERLSTTNAPTFALQFADADPSAQAALDFTRLLAPEGLSFASRFGTFTPQDPAAQANPPEESRAASPAEPADASDDETAPGGDTATGSEGNASVPEDPATDGVPSITELTAVESSLPGTAWPATDTITGEVLDLLVRNGYSRVLASDENVSIAGGGARGSLNGIEYLVSDTALDDAARSALDASTETGHRSGVALTSALLVLRAQAGAPGAVLAFDRGATPESPYAAELLDTISALPWVDPVAPEALPEATATLLPAAEAADPDRTEALKDAVAREPLVRDYSRVLVDPANLIDLQRVRLLQLFSARYTTANSNFTAAADRSAERDAATLDGVNVVTSTHTQLVGTTSRVPVQVRNTLPFDALVTAVAVPTNAALIVTGKELEPALIPSESSSNILVPVRARVSSGESGLAVELTAASGGEVVTSGMLAISIRSSWESVALGSLAVLTAAFFGFGIWRSIRRRSKASSEDTGIVEP